MDSHFLLASVISVKTRQKEREKRKLERSDEEENTAWPYVGNKRSNTNRIGWQLVIGPVGREFECIWHSAVVTSNGFTVT